MLVAIMHVTRRAGTNPGCELVSDCTVVSSLAVVSEFPRDRAPTRTVADSGTGECVRNLVQQNLMDLVVFVAPGEVAGDGYPVLVEATEPGARLRIVEAERPDRGIEVQRDEGFSPFAHPIQFSHASRLTLAAVSRPRRAQSREHSYLDEM